MAENKPVRIEPDRRWFNNVRVTDQKTLSNLRKEIENQSHDTYSLLLRKRNIPMSLITPMSQDVKVNRQVETFKDTFGKGARRTKPTLNVFNLNEYASTAENKIQNYSLEKDNDFTRLSNICKTNIAYINDNGNETKGINIEKNSIKERYVLGLIFLYSCV